MKQQKKYLSHLLFLNGKVLANHLCIVGDGGCISAEPFEEETASTGFIDGILIAGNEKLPEHLDGLKSIISVDSNCGLRECAERIATYMTDNDLTDEEMKNRVLVSLNITNAQLTTSILKNS